MGISVKGWLPPSPGEALPQPRVQDDSWIFDLDTVKHIRAWLDQTKNQFIDQPPTPITINLSRNGASNIEYGVGLGVKELVHFRHCTVEIILPVKDGVRTWQARYRYVAARDQYNRVIVGPQIKVIQDARIELAACLSTAN